MSKHKPFVTDRPSYRPARFAERVKEELSDLVPGDLKDPRINGLKLVTMTQVDITPDLKYAKIYFLLMNPKIKDSEIKDAEKALNKASPYLRRELMKRIKTKITPHLTFLYDTAYENKSAMDQLFRKIESLPKIKTDSEE